MGCPLRNHPFEGTHIYGKPHCGESIGAWSPEGEAFPVVFWMLVGRAECVFYMFVVRCEDGVAKKKTCLSSANIPI